MESTLLEVDTVEVCDLELPTRRGLEPRRVVHDIGSVEVEPGHGVVAARLLRLLLQRNSDAILVQLYYPVRRRVGDLVAEDRGTVERLETPQLGAESSTVEDVVPQNETYGVVPHVVGSEVERLGKPVRGRLHGVGQLDPELRAVAQQTSKQV